MGSQDVNTDWPASLSYNDALTYFFLVAGSVCVSFGIAAAYAHRFLLTTAVIARLRASIPVIPIESLWITRGLAGLYAIGLSLTSPLPAFLLISHESINPHLWIVLLIHFVFIVLGLLMPAGNSLPKLMKLIAWWSAAVACGMSIQAASMFDYVRGTGAVGIGFAAGVPLAAAVAYTYWGLLPMGDDDKPISLTDAIRKARGNVWFWLSLFLTCLSMILLTLLLAGICLAPFADNVARVKSSISTNDLWRFPVFRSTQDSPCREGILVCHVYLTAGPDLTTGVYVNVHLGPDAVSFLDVRVDGSDKGARAEPIPTPALHARDQRQVFSVLLKDLSPGTQHSFTLWCNLGSLGDTPYTFRTASLEGVKFAIGGDAGVSVVSNDVLEQIVQTNPDLIVIGGDVAYDNGVAACACVWDAFLSMLDLRMDHSLIPLTFAVGNHDIGFNDRTWDFARQAVESDPSNAPLLFQWFPQSSHTGNPGNRVHAVGSLVNVWVMDSGYLSPPSDVVAWVDSEMPSHKKAVHQIAVYHMPLYSSLEHEYAAGEYLRSSWPNGIFDKHKFIAAFENHSHMFKRMIPLVANEPAPDGKTGTVFFGDGNIGAVDGSFRDLREGDSRYAKIRKDFHYFTVTVRPERVTVTAINHEGVIIDSWVSDA